jgi:microcystin-dependent protein
MEEYMGVIKLFAGNFVPQNYMMCNGALLPISQYQALFAIIGTTYGGNGTSTFALPNLQGQVAIGAGQSRTGTSYVEGETAGTENVTLTINNLPAHTHTGSVVVSSANSDISTPVANSVIGTPGTMSGRTFTAGVGYTNSSPDVKLSPASVITASTGNSQPTPIMQPYLALNYIICVYGVFPPRQ